jgi:uncharacterized protein YcbX
MSVQSWPLTARGLLFDREWAVVDSQGNVLNQKVCATMSLIVPTVDVEGKALRIQYVGDDASILIPSTDAQELFIELDEQSAAPVLIPSTRPETTECQMQSNGETRLGMPLDDWQGRARVDDWFSCILGRRCRLVRQHGGSALSFVNEGSILAVVQASVEDVQARLAKMLMTKKRLKNKDMTGQQRDPDDEAPLDKSTLMSSFRANLVLVGIAPAYSEDYWVNVRIAGCGGGRRESGENPRYNAELKAVAACSRCTMVNIDQSNASTSSAPLLTLAKYRRQHSKILFGQYLQLSSSNTVTIRVGDHVSTTTATTTTGTTDA